MRTKILRMAIVGFILIIIGFIGMSLNKFNFGDDPTEYQNTWAFDTDTINQLIVNSDYSIDIKFVHSTDGKQTIELEGHLEEDTIAKLDDIHPQNGKFEINITDDSFHFFNISFKSHNVQLTVALPEQKQLQEVTFNFNSSNGKISNVTADNVELTTRSGNLTLQSIIAEQLTIALNSGNLTGTDIQANTEATIKSGNINLKEYSGIGKFSSNSGNIKLTQKGPASLDLTVKSGNVTLTADPEFKGFYDLNAESGNIDAPESLRLTNDLIKVRTKSGNINIRQ